MNWRVGNTIWDHQRMLCRLTTSLSIGWNCCVGDGYGVYFPPIKAYKPSTPEPLLVYRCCPQSHECALWVYVSVQPQRKWYEEWDGWGWKDSALEFLRRFSQHPTLSSSGNVEAAAINLSRVAWPTLPISMPLTTTRHRFLRRLPDRHTSLPSRLMLSPRNQTLQTSAREEPSPPSYRWKNSAIQTKKRSQILIASSESVK